MRKILVAVLLGGMFAICLEHIFTIDDALSLSTKVQAQSSQRFEFQAVGKFGWYGEPDPRTVSFTVAAICDTANGNLIYISGSSQSSPAIDKGGCAKDPRR